MAAAPSFLSLEQFESLYRGEKPHFEYWFGEAIQKSRPTSVHGVFQWILAMLLARRGWKASTEVRIKLSAHAHPVPDVVADRHRIQSPYPTEPFDLCIEILSPNDDLRRTFQKAAHYLDWGIGCVWIVDPERRIAYMMSTVHPSPVELKGSDHLIAGPELQPVFSLAELFAEVDTVLSGD